ncbi:MAG: hypothetical protein AAF716_11765 [Cyanobacteria bacterium P01_D01_bin.1]
MTNSHSSSHFDPIVEAVRYIKGEGKAPASIDVVNALLQAEKENKRAKSDYRYEQLVGEWRLGFVSGTRKVQPRPGASAVTTVGKGRFIPRFVRIAIAYEPLPENEQGSVTNSVALGPINLRLKGPTKFWQKTNSLGFDFTAIKVSLNLLGSDWSAYDGELRGGQTRDAAFKAQMLKDQAFFTFFLVDQDYIAARGRGGGLALWIKEAA